MRSRPTLLSLAAIAAATAIVLTSSVRPDLLGRPASHLSAATAAQAKEDFDPPVVKELDCHQFKPPGTPPFQYKIFTGKAECEVAYWDQNYYFELDFYRVRGRRIPVLVLVSKHSLKTHRRILLLTGGPRGILISPDDVMKNLVEAGWTIFLPVYQGQAETAYPDGDSEEALSEIAALRRLLLRDSDLVIGESAGGYLAAADCGSNGGNQRRLLLAPLLLAPVDQYEASRRSFDQQALAAAERPLCIPKAGSTPIVQACAPDIEMQEAFWGKYRSTSVSDMLSNSPSCRRRTSIFISPDDERIYSASAVDELTRSGVTVTELPHIKHVQMESDERVIALTRDWAERDRSWLAQISRRLTRLFS